jgi:hypothetical protein
MSRIVIVILTYQHRNPVDLRVLRILYGIWMKSCKRFRKLLWG